MSGHGQLLGLPAYGHNAVEAGVAYHRYVVDADAGQQFARSFVLHIQVGVGAEHAAEESAVGPEEYLVGAENGRDDVGGNLSSPQLAQVVAPELIFDEDGYRRFQQVEKAAYVARQVKGQVAHQVGQRIVFPHLISRRGEKRESDFLVGVLFFYLFDKRTSLFKLTQRRGVYPDVSSLFRDLFFEIGEDAFLARRQFPRFGIAPCGDFYQ